jgi:hypothetical protein
MPHRTRPRRPGHLATPTPNPNHPTPPPRAAPEPGGRRATRSRKVSARLAVVDQSTRQQAAQARLDALEADNAGNDDPFGLVDDDDEEFVVASNGEEGEAGRSGCMGL